MSLEGVFPSRAALGAYAARQEARKNEQLNRSATGCLFALRSCLYNLKRARASKLIGLIGTAGGLTILLAFPIGKSEPATPTIKVPRPYPYETPARVPTPPIAELSPAPSPAPFSYPESSPSLLAAQVRNSRITHARRPLTPKTVREAALKYNGVPNFCGFLAALPADVGVLDPKLGRTRELVKGGRVVPKNVAWLRKHMHGKRP
jgi:hypothetical protein